MKEKIGMKMEDIIAMEIPMYAPIEIKSATSRDYRTKHHTFSTVSYYAGVNEKELLYHDTLHFEDPLDGRKAKPLCLIKEVIPLKRN